MVIHYVKNIRFNRKIKNEVRIHIGDYYTTRDPVIISTLLGSCVAVCLRDRENGISGMNHILLPGEADLRKLGMQTRYGINAMEELIHSMMRKGADRQRLTAKVFGGANVLPSIVKYGAVGPKIVKLVTRFLRIEKIPVLARDVGGTRARKIYFDTDVGDVHVKKLKPVKFLKVTPAERENEKKI